MKWLHPWLLAAALPAGLLLVGLLHRARIRAARGINRFAGDARRPWAAPGWDPVRRRLDLWLPGLTLALCLVALARPMRFHPDRATERVGVPYLVALDASRSMLATDLRPSRWAAATNALDRFLARTQGDRVGLITFAGVAHLNAPLSFDSTALRTTLRYVDPNTMGEPGSSLAAAVERAGRYFATNNIRPRILVLLSDGEDLEGQPLLVARRWAREGLRIAAVGVGTASGSRVPLTRSPQGPAARNTFGQEVVSRLNEGNLQRLAAATGGKYYRLGERGEGLEQLRSEFLAPLAETAAREDLQNYSEWYHVPLALATACLVAGLLLGADRRQAPRRPEPVLQPPTP